MKRPSIFEIATAFEEGKNGEIKPKTIPGGSFESNKQKNDYIINDDEKKEELFKFFNTYGQYGIKINVGPEVSELIE